MVRFSSQPRRRQQQGAINGATKERQDEREESTGGSASKRMVLFYVFIIATNPFSQSIFGGMTSISSSDDKGNSQPFEQVGFASSNASSDSTLPSERWQSTFEFPTPQERVQYYMGSWYNKSITDKAFCKFEKLLLGVPPPKDFVQSEDTLYSLNTLNMRDPTNRLRGRYRNNYLKDSSNVLSHAESSFLNAEKYVIMNIGDVQPRHLALPVVTTARSLPTSDNFNKTGSSIVWPLNVNRHFQQPLKESKKANDTPWDQKKNSMIWRGGCNWLYKNNPRKIRLNFVERYYASNPEVDILFKVNHPDCLQYEFNTNYYGQGLNYEEHLQYKYLLSLEGNDVATGLKWQLASSSVVFMHPPTKEAYAMEALLQPYVHYIPVKEDASDVLTQVQWARENDEKAKWISAQATKYMDDLWLSDQAVIDNSIVRNGLARVYHEQFGEDLARCHKARENRTDVSK